MPDPALSSRATSLLLINAHSLTECKACTKVARKQKGNKRYKLKNQRRKTNKTIHSSLSSFVRFRESRNSHNSQTQSRPKKKKLPVFDGIAFPAFPLLPWLLPTRQREVPLGRSASSSRAVHHYCVLFKRALRLPLLATLLRQGRARGTQRQGRGGHIRAIRLALLVHVQLDGLFTLPPFILGLVLLAREPTGLEQLRLKKKGMKRICLFICLFWLFCSI